MKESQPARYRWVIMALSVVTAALVISIPFSCMPALFEEIRDDLGLTLVQIGTIWGIGSFAALLMNILGGFLGDRFRAREMLVVLCLLAGITGAARGLAQGLLTLAVTFFINSLVRTVIPIVVTRMIGTWFRGQNLGMANGISAMGMGLGLMLGPMISATLVSPALGGWRHVLYFYGAISVAVAGVWLLFGREPPGAISASPARVSEPAKKALVGLLRNKSLWFVGLALLFRQFMMTGLIGYLPLYLRGQEWTQTSADGALSAFFAASTVFVIPLSIFSDRIGRRKAVLLPAAFLATACIGLLPFAHGGAVLALAVLAGMSFDGFMAVVVTNVLETQGVGPGRSGTALGLVFTISQPGGILGPPIGNAFASLSAGAPFFFWASISVPALIFLFLVKETGWKANRPAFRLAG
jgi:MFS family permease